MPPRVGNIRNESRKFFFSNYISFLLSFSPIFIDISNDYFNLANSNMKLITFSFVRWKLFFSFFSFPMNAEQALVCHSANFTFAKQARQKLYNSRKCDKITGTLVSWEGSLDTERLLYIGHIPEPSSNGKLLTTSKALSLIDIEMLCVGWGWNVIMCSYIRSIKRALKA